MLPQFRDEEYILKPNLLFKLLTHLNIICEILGSGQERTYMMPALLQYNRDLTEIMKTEKNLIPPLCISFDGGCAPGGLFCALVANLLNSHDHWELSMDDGVPTYVAIGIVFLFFMTSYSPVTLIDLFSHIRIYVPSPDPRYPPPHYQREQCIVPLRK